MRITSRLSSLCGTLFLLCALVLNLYGQATEGKIFGTITDSSGAVVPNATITVTSVERGTVQSTVTNGDGIYTVPAVELGSYIVSVQAPGFKRAVNPPVTITVKAQLRLDVALEVGDTGQTVDIKDTAPIIRTGTAEVSNTITRQQLQNLPVLGRNIISLAALTPGANGGTAGGRQTAISGAAVVVGGAPGEANNYIIDGVSNNMEFSGTLSVTPPIDSVQEFAVQTSQYSAEFGHSAGGVINLGLKSGSNQFHGFAYDYLQNDLLNARPYDFTGANPPKQAVRRNQFGVGGGGRIIKDRAFWFANYEGLRSPTSTLAQFIVPTAAEKRGDFSAGGYNIYNQFSLHQDPSNPSLRIRDQFPNNIIPPSLISAAGAGLLKYFPDPNFVSPNPNIRNNLLTRQSANENSNFVNIKGDLAVNQKNTVSLHESHQNRIQTNTGWLPDNRIATSTGIKGENAGINYTHVFSPTLINETRVSYNRTDMPVLLANQENVIDPYNVPGWKTNPFGPGFPTISIANESGVAPIRIGPFGAPFQLTENTYQLIDTMTWQKGAHSIKFGIEATNQRLARFQARSGGGTMTFSGTYSTQRPGDPVTVPRSGVTDILTGNASNLLTQYGFDAIRIRNYRLNAFVQDDWRVSRKLVLNLGLRYDFFEPYHEEQDRLANFDLSTGTRLVPESARKVVQNTLGLPNGDLPSGWKYVPLDQIIPHANKTNFSPRLGFAYAVNNKLALRGGWGFYYGVMASNTANNSGTEGNPFFFDFQILGDSNTPVTFSQGFPSGGIVNVLASPSFGAYYGPLDRKDPYAGKYSATVEWSPINDLTISGGYIGQQTFNYPTLVAGNSAAVPASTALVPRQPYPNVGFFWAYVPAADSNYNALILSATRRFHHGLTFQTAFTWSKALGYDTGGDQTLTNRLNLRYDYGRLDYDLTRRWLTYWTYDLPKLSGAPLFARVIAGGWSTSGIMTFQSGFPFSVTASGAALNIGTIGGTGNRANVVGDPHLPSDKQNANQWFNKSAFAVPASFTWGNAGKNILRGPGLFNVDFALQKSFSVIRESHRITFRMEATNLTNRVNYGNPGSNISAANFGVITGLQSGARRLQAALRFDF